MNTENTTDVAAPAAKNVDVKISAKFKLLADKKTKELVTPARPVSVALTAPTFAELTADQQAQIYNSVLEKIVRGQVREAMKTVPLATGKNKEDGPDGEILISQPVVNMALSLTIDDILNTSEEISEELEEEVVTAFIQYLASLNKSEKAQKIFGAFLVAGVKMFVTVDSGIVEKFSQALTSWQETLEAEKLEEYMPMFNRVSQRIDKAAKAREELF